MGLLGDVLPYLYGRADAMKRQLSDAVANPLDALRNVGDNVARDIQSARGLLSAASDETNANLRAGIGMFQGPANARLTQIMIDSYAPSGMAIDPAAQRKLVEALRGKSAGERFRIGDVTKKQADELDAANGLPARGLLDVFVSPIGERHVFGRRIEREGFTPEQVGVFAKQAMLPTSSVTPPFKQGDYGLLSSIEMLDPITRRTYSAQMPLSPVTDGFELVSVIPRGIKKK